MSSLEQDMQDLFKNVISDNTSIADSLLSSKFPNIKKGNVKSDGLYIYEALERKTFYKEEGSDTVLAFTDRYLVEVSDKTINEIIDAIEKYTNYIKNNIETEETGIGVKNVADILGIYEGAFAAYIDTPRYHRLRKEIADFLKNKYETGDEETKRRIRAGYTEFFSKSKASIPVDVVKFPNMKIRILKDGTRRIEEGLSKYAIKVEEDKKSLRNEFIFKMLDDGLWDYDFLFESGIISNVGGYDLNTFIKNSKTLTNKQKINAFIVSGTADDRKDVLDYYKENDKRFFLELATGLEIYEAYNEGVIQMKDLAKNLKKEDLKEFSPEKLEELFSIINFPKNTDFLTMILNKKTNRTDKYISKEIFDILNSEQIMKLVLSDKIVYQIPLESKDYIDLYGTLSLENISVLKENGKVQPEDIIKLSKFVSREEYNQILDYILLNYDRKTLKELLDAGKLNKAFVKTFNENALGQIDDKKRNEYFNKLLVLNEDISEEEKKENEIFIINLLKTGIKIPEEIKIDISKDTISEMYLEDEINDDFIFALYRDGRIAREVLEELYNKNDLKAAYKAGKIGIGILNYLPEREKIIKEELEAKKITIGDVIGLYSEEDGLDIDELKEILEKQELNNVELSDFIPDGCKEYKIKDLFNNYFISHDELSYLVTRGIISKEKADEYAELLNTHDVFESIFGNVSDAVLTRETEQGDSKAPSEKRFKNPRAAKIKNDPELISMLLDECEFDKRVINLHGENNSLDGYSVRASEKYGLMVFSNFEKAGNATYVTSFQQGLFFLKRLVSKKKLEDGTVEEKVEKVTSEATKQELRETEHVKVRNASKWLGKNIVDSMRKISTKFNDDYKKDKNYKDRIELIIQEINRDYTERKLEDR